MIFSKKRSSRHRILALLLQAIIFFGLYLGAKAWMQRDMVHGMAPQVTARNLQNQVVSLKDYRGQPLLLHFWASWCKICKFEQGAITSVAKKWPVLTVAMQSGNRQDIKGFMHRNNLAWPTILDETGSLAQRYGVVGVPAHFIIDSHGEIRFRETGYTTSWGLKIRLWLTKLLS
ncbi:MAG TPA: protein disulfide oxidoreductase [Gammaproteobacteria bacterium]|nr:protein disulfide oxidoreductase [Gammaproteobacteria bacterium]